MLGFAGAAIAAATAITGIAVALESERRVHTVANAGTMMDPYVFLMFPTMNIGLFALFVGLAILKRNRPDTHKRLMLLGTISLIGPALARLVTMAVKGLGMVGLPGVVGAVLLMNVFIAAIAIRDLKTRGRLHPATLWGGGLFVLSEPLRFVIAFSEPWQAFARALMN
jgi:apolipoprotein N-acyltransferase